jgi:GntR family transcriptional regulator
MWLSINENDSRPLYLQIINQIKEQVRKGALKPGDELPSVRELAESLGINMHTVRSAYLRLRDQELITLRLGRRATIARLKQPANKKGVEGEITARLEELITDALLKGLKTEEIQKLLNQQTENLKHG